MVAQRTALRIQNAKAAQSGFQLLRRVLVMAPWYSSIAFRGGVKKLLRGAVSLYLSLGVARDGCGSVADDVEVWAKATHAEWP